MNESLVKYLAGLLDADGSLTFAFKEDPNRPGLFFVGMHLRLSSSLAVDVNGFVDTLPSRTRMGATYRSGPKRQFVTWFVSKRSDLEMLVPRLVKHMVIKGKHWNWLLHRWRELRAETMAVTAEERAALIDASKTSRQENVGPLKPKNHPTWAWLAGYLDGDGCYTFRRQATGTKSLVMNVSAVAHQNDIGVLEFILKAFGGHIYDHGQSENVKVWRRSLGFQNRSFALAFLPQMVKHSRLKRHKIEAMIHHHRQRLSVQGTEVQAIV